MVWEQEDSKKAEYLFMNGLFEQKPNICPIIKLRWNLLLLVALMVQNSGTLYGGNGTNIAIQLAQYLLKRAGYK